MDAHEKQSKDSQPPKHEGDVLGISDSPPEPGIPGVVNRGSGHPQGIEVRRPATGIGDVAQHSGATSIDMGGGGEGQTVEDTTVPDRHEKAEE